MKNTKTIWTAILSALAVGYALLRFRQLTDSCLWFDEIFGAHAAGLEWGGMLQLVARDLIHPPLFYALLKIWTALGGESLFWLRFFPVLFSLLALFAFYQFCKQLKLSSPAMAVAFVFFAANGALIKYAQEVRMYALFLFLSIVSMWLFTRFLHLGKNIWLLTLCNVLLVYTHYFGWFVPLAEIIVILVFQRIKIRQVLIMFGLCLLAFTPWLYAVFRAARLNSDIRQNVGWIARPDAAEVFQFAFDLIEPFYFQASSAAAGANYLIAVPLLLLTVAAMIFYLSRFNELSETGKVNFWMLAIFIATPVFLAFVLSWILPVSIWGTRHLIMVFAPALVLTGAFFERIKPEILRIVFVSVLLFLFALAFIAELRRPPQDFIWCAWEDLAGAVEPDQPQKIYVFEDLVAYHFWFAVKNEPLIQVAKIEGVEGVAEDKAYFLPRGFDDVKKVGLDEIEEPRFFIAFRDAEFNTEKPPLKNLLKKGYQVGEPKTIEAQGMKAFLVEIRRGK
jgi:uncharacterized membrane protein